MRRGLIAWSRAELPEAALAARVERTRAALAKAGLTALVLYTNNTRPAAASWLCGFVPYWSEGLLVLPRDGEPMLVVALSKRVQSWIEATSRVSGVVSTPRIGREAGRLIAAGKGGPVGVADLDGLPVGIADELRESGLLLVDATLLFAELRGHADPAELALAMKAASIAQQALAQAISRHDHAAPVIAAVELRARELGAEECYVAVAIDLARERHLRRIEGPAPLGQSFAIRATVAYKGAWVRSTRTLFRDETKAPLLARAAERFAGAVATLPNPRGMNELESWLVEGCRVAQPLSALMGSAIAEPTTLAPGALVSVQACIALDGHPILIGGAALLGAAGEAAGLLIPPLI